MKESIEESQTAIWMQLLADWVMLEEEQGWAQSVRTLASVDVPS